MEFVTQNKRNWVHENFKRKNIRKQKEAISYIQFYEEDVINPLSTKNIDLWDTNYGTPLYSLNKEKWQGKPCNYFTKSKKQLSAQGNYLK